MPRDHGFPEAFAGAGGSRQGRQAGCAGSVYGRLRGDLAPLQGQPPRGLDFRHGRRSGQDGAALRPESHAYALPSRQRAPRGAERRFARRRPAGSGREVTALP